MIGIVQHWQHSRDPLVQAKDKPGQTRPSSKKSHPVLHFIADCNMVKCIPKWQTLGVVVQLFYDFMAFMFLFAPPLPFVNLGLQLTVDPCTYASWFRGHFASLNLTFNHRTTDTPILFQKPTEITRILNFKASLPTASIMWICMAQKKL